MTTTTEMPTVCPYCDYHHECVTGLREPDDGDVSLCFQCGHLNMFDSTVSGGLRRPTKKEARQLERDMTVERIMMAWMMAKQEN